MAETSEEGLESNLSGITAAAATNAGTNPSSQADSDQHRMNESRKRDASTAFSDNSAGDAKRLEPKQANRGPSRPAPANNVQPWVARPPATQPSVQTLTRGGSHPPQHFMTHQWVLIPLPSPQPIPYPPPYQQGPPGSISQQAPQQSAPPQVPPSMSLIHPAPQQTAQSLSTEQAIAQSAPEIVGGGEEEMDATPRSGSKQYGFNPMRVRGEAFAGAGHVQEWGVHSILRVPPDIRTWRERLFQVKDAIVLTPAEKETYWPFVDNFWAIKGGIHRTERKSSITYHYRCRNHETQRTQSGTVRNRPVRQVVGDPCRCSISIAIKFAKGCMPDAAGEGGIALEYRFQRSRESPDHTPNCTIEGFDRRKRNTALVAIAGKQVANGYSAKDTLDTILAKNNPAAHQECLDAGGEFFKLSDCYNAGNRLKKARASLSAKEGGTAGMEEAAGVDGEGEDVAQEGGEAAERDPAVDPELSEDGVVATQEDRRRSDGPPRPGISGSTPWVVPMAL